METIGTSIPYKWRAALDEDIREIEELNGGNEVTQSDVMAAGVFVWQCLEAQDRLDMVNIARSVRKNKVNDII